MDKEGLATVCVVDQVREDALKAVNDLKKNGIKTAMLTGDRAEIAKETGDTLKIDEVYAELFPEDKLKCIEEMKGKDGLVAMVGDGVNDAPALAASDVGIAMGAAGVDVALESADVVLVKDELAQIPYLIKLSDKTMGYCKTEYHCITYHKINFRSTRSTRRDRLACNRDCRRRRTYNASFAKFASS